ncbi:hypothetical protein FS842_009219, partial [Serendipita sp. 407]
GWLPRSLQFKLKTKKEYSNLSDTVVNNNGIRCVFLSRSPPPGESEGELAPDCLREFDEKLRRRRMFPETEGSNMEHIKTFLGPKFGEFFEQGNSENILDSVGAIEALHYTYLILIEALHDAQYFGEGKEPNIYTQLWPLITHRDKATGLVFGFHSRWEFPLVAFLDDEKKNVKLTPVSDGSLRINNLPYMIMEIASGDSGKDLYRLQLQAACLARFGNDKGVRQSNEKPTVITAIYISNEFKATRYLFCQPHSTENAVVYTETTFDLASPSESFQLVFELYNLPSVTKEQNGTPSDEFIKHVANGIHANIRTTLTGYERTDHGHTTNEGTADEGAADKRNKGKKRKLGERETDSPSTVERAILDAGYTFDDWDEFESMLPLSDKLHEARAPNGLSVIVKYVRRGSNEVEILKYLKECGGPAHHIIELLDVIQFDGGQMIVVPECIPLPLRELNISLNISIVSSLQTQFLEGVEYMHKHGVAHLDLKPENVVLKLKSQPNLPTLFILDFDCAVWVNGVETMRKGLRGTHSWTAPEVSNKHEYSPILADRWACGRMLKYIRKDIKVAPEMEELSCKLMDKNPFLRPALHDVIKLRRIRPMPNRAWTKDEGPGSSHTPTQSSLVIEI